MNEYQELKDLHQAREATERALASLKTGGPQTDEMEKNLRDELIQICNEAIEIYQKLDQLK